VTVVDRTEAGTTWAELGRLDPLAAVLDSADERGVKNRLINRVHKVALRRAVGDLVGREVLDFGCGTGRLTEWLVRRGAVVHGVDVTPEMADVARRRVPEARISVIDGSALPFSDERFDLVVSAYVLQYYVGHGSALTQELARVLRSAGALVAIEQVADGDLGRGGSLPAYEEMFQAVGLNAVESRMIRMGDSMLMGLACRHAALSVMPLLPRLIEWEARRQRSVPLIGGRYADVLFTATRECPRASLTR
jgi:ubiquinone/menaquinone biosynthesis C-methylase UbiE